MAHQREILEGYVVDIACIRHYPRYELFEQAAAHTRQCALEPHCLETGYGLVKEGNRLALLDEHATLQIADVIRRSSQEAGIVLRVERRLVDGTMRTVSVEEVERGNTKSVLTDATSERAAAKPAQRVEKRATEASAPRAPDGKTAERYAG